jgi:hypothetical protein
VRLSSAAMGTYHPQYRPLSAIRYLNANLLPTRYTLFITLVLLGGDTASLDLVTIVLSFPFLVRTKYYG